jgi:twitching motility two-component system response regulator PilH
MAKILIVDDSETERQHLSKLLLAKDHQLSIAHNAEEGLAMARDLLPDLILMDVVMPGLNGFQATRQLSKDPDTAHIPIIIVSTKDQQTDQIWAQRQGAKAYLVKPVKKELLYAELEKLLS